MFVEVGQAILPAAVPSFRRRFGCSYATCVGPADSPPRGGFVCIVGAGRFFHSFPGGPPNSLVLAKDFPQAGPACVHDVTHDTRPPCPTVPGRFPRTPSQRTQDRHGRPRLVIVIGSPCCWISSSKARHFALNSVALTTRVCMIFIIIITTEIVYRAYSYRKASIGSTRAARRAGA